MPPPPNPAQHITTGPHEHTIHPDSHRYSPLLRRIQASLALLNTIRTTACNPARKPACFCIHSQHSSRLALSPPASRADHLCIQTCSSRSIRRRAFAAYSRIASEPPHRPHHQLDSAHLPCLIAAAASQANMTSPKRRIETDVMKLLMSDYEITLINDSMQEFYVRFHGPQETPFAGGVWKIHVELPDQYPYKSPSIGFMNKIFHPNIDELSGSVCLDVINQTWSPMFDCINIFEVFLPQLLRYPNPTDPLNGEAAALLMREPKTYEARVKDYVQRFATREAANAAGQEEDEDEEEEDEMSDVGSFSDHEPMGDMEM